MDHKTPKKVKKITMKLLHIQLLAVLLVTTVLRTSGELKRLRQNERRQQRPLSACDLSCPCCSWLEFRGAIYTAPVDDCYIRDTAEFENYAVIRCEPYQVAYMSYDYERGEQYCGTSSSDREYLSDNQAVACQNVIQNKIDKTGISCRYGGDTFHMCGSGCTADCPCCTGAYPEYVQAMETDNADSCYYRDDANSEITAIIHCGDPYLVAYMSYDYTNGQHYCGTSSSSAIEYLTIDQVVACETPILNKIARESLSCGLDGFDACT
jgi:hypothetical protein